MVIRQGDVLLCQTPNGGEIQLEDGQIVMTGRFDTLAYLALFGGNEDDAGGDDLSQQWWGNIGEPDPNAVYRSRTQFLMRSLPLTSASLLAVQDAASLDLQVLRDLAIVSSVDVVASIPAPNTLKLKITALAQGELSEFEFTENWTAPA